MKKEIKWKFTKNKKDLSIKVSNWIVATILKLPTKELKEFFLLIENELVARGEF